MKKSVKRILSLVMVLAISLSFYVITAEAAATVALSVPATSTVGSTVTVTVKYNSDKIIGAMDGDLEYNNTVLEYVSGSATCNYNDFNFLAGGAGGKVTFSGYKVGSTYKTVTYTFKFKVIKTGSASVSVITTAMSDEVGTDYTALPSKKTDTVTVSDVQKSSNANLKSVDIGVAAQNGAPLGRGTLTPAFNKNTTSYTIKVPYNTYSVSITGYQEDAKAQKPSTTGAWASNAASWERKVTVTAENGTTKTYTFKIVRDKKPDDVSSTPTPTPPPVSSETPSEPDDSLNVIVEDKSYTINTVIGNDKKPAGFISDISSYNGVEIPVYKSNDGKMTVAVLKDGEKKDTFFIYDKDKIQFEKLEITKFNGKDYILANFQNYLENSGNYTAQIVEVFGKQVNCIKKAEDSEFVYLWAVNDEGIGGIYSYDIKEKTIQRADLTENNGNSSNVGNDAVTTVDPLSKNISTEIYVITAAGLILVILIMLVVTFAVLGKNKELKKELKNGRKSSNKLENKPTETPAEKLFAKQLEEAKIRNEDDLISLFDEQDEMTSIQENQEFLVIQNKPMFEETAEEKTEAEEMPIFKESIDETDKENDALFDEKELEAKLFKSSVPEKTEPKIEMFKDDIE